MARVRSNNSDGGGDKKYVTSKVNTKDYSSVYNREQQQQMSNEFKGDKRTMAAAIKKDLGNTEIKRYPAGSQGHQQSAHQSLENQVKRTQENQAGTGTTPSNTEARDKYIERTSTEATKLDKYTKTDNPTGGTTTTKKKFVYKK